MRLPRRLGCLGWICVGLWLLAMLGGGGWLWYASTGDLRAVAARARAAGLPTSVAELAPPSPPELPAALTDLGRLALRYPPGNPWEKLPRLDEEVPDAVVARQAAIPAEFWRDLHDALARAGGGAVPDGPLVARRRSAAAEGLDGVMALYFERLLIAPATDLPDLVADAAVVPLAVRPAQLLDLDRACGHVSLLYHGVTRRLGELRGTPAGAVVATHLRGLGTALWRASPGAWHGALVVAFDQAGRPTPPSLPGTWRDWRETQAQLGGLLALRCTRAALLGDIIAQAQAVAAAASPADLLTIIALPQAATAPAWLPWPGDSDDRDFRPGDYPLVRELRLLLALEVLISELEAGPPPRDWFAPSAAALRPVLRDGRRIGWYSVGRDGVDGGGRRSLDYGFAMTEAFGEPDFAATPRPRRPPAPPSPPPSGVPSGMPPGMLVSPPRP